MCGIAGIISDSAIDGSTILRMVQALKHRGPDDEGYVRILSDENNDVRYSGPDSPDKQFVHVTQAPPVRRSVFFGHRRLSIIDLSQAGHQPMSYDNGNLWIVFNGEIYNYRELRDDLKARGCEFHSSSDTEVILAAYQEWGETCVKRFNGDWAFAIYDKRKKLVFLSRDRYAIKPLYYFHNPGGRTFAFASEIKALMQLPFVGSAVNDEKNYEFIVYSLLEHSDNTSYRAIQQVEPGQNIVVALDQTALSRVKYYALSRNGSMGFYRHSRAKSYAADIRDLLVDSVRLRLRADVSIGSCLSGGLDSSSIVVIINKLLKEGGVSGEQLGQKQKTFTASFPGEPSDETLFAQRVIAHTNAEPYFVYPHEDGLQHEMANLMHHQDEPFTSASIYAQWKVMETASKYVKVILDGQGGDEVFGGYANYRCAYLAQAIRNFRMVALFTELAGVLKMSKSFGQVADSLKRLPIYLAPQSMKFALHRTWKKDLIRDTLVKLNMSAGIVPVEFISSSFVPNLNEVLCHYQMKYSLPQLLRYEDRNSMAFSIESRTPFTDYRLVDYAFSIPATYKYKNGWSKWLLRLAMQDILPTEIVWRKDKIGFAVSRTMQEYDRSIIYDLWKQMNAQRTCLRK